MYLILARHGETASNQQDLLQGQTDISLNEKGLNQARTLGGALREERLEFIYSSDLKRGHQTALIIGSILKLPVITSPLARERCFGVFEGTNRTQFYSHERSLPDPYSNRPQGGESFEDLYSRAQKFLEQLLQKHLGERVLVVCHGDFARMCLGVLLGKGVREACQIPQKNCCINRLEVRTMLASEIIRLNDVGYLPTELVSINKSEL